MNSKFVLTSLFSLCVLLTTANAEVLSELSVPTKIILIQSDDEYSLELPQLKTDCQYSFLAEGLRGIIDCKGKFSPFSKTITVKTNPFVKQLRF